MEVWIREHFHIEGEEFKWFIHRDGNSVPVSASISDFIDMFGATAPESATELKSRDPDDIRGWHRHFDAWVEQGIIAP